MDKYKDYIKQLTVRVGIVYKPIFLRGYLLLADADNEWQKFVAENQSHIKVRSLYFLPMLALLVGVHFSSVLLSAIFGLSDGSKGILERLCLLFFQTVMLSLLCYSLTGIVIKLLFSIRRINWLNFGDSFDLNRASVLIVFPYCLSMFSQILENLWSNFFFVSLITTVLSFMIVWKGLVYIVPEYLQKHPTKHIWVTLIIGAMPLVLNKVCIGLLKILMS